MVFSTYGKVVHVHMLPQNARSGQRCAFVFYDAYEAAEDAVKVLNGIYKIREEAVDPIVVQWGRSASKGGGDGPSKGGSSGWSTWNPAGDHVAWKQDSIGVADAGNWGRSPGGGEGHIDGCRVFVGGLAHDVSDSELKSVFSTYGEVTGVKMLAQNNPSSGLKTALVFYKTLQAAEDAIQTLSGVYKIRTDALEPIYVCWGKDSRASGPSKGGGAKGGWEGGSESASDGGKSGPHLEGHKLFIGGLAADCTEEDLAVVFKTYGEVTGVKMMQKPATSGLKSAFVFYATEQAGDDAIKVLHGKYKIREDAELPINVCWARSPLGKQGGGWNDWAQESFSKGAGQSWASHQGARGGGMCWGSDGKKPGAMSERRPAVQGMEASGSRSGQAGSGQWTGSDGKSKLYVANLPQDIDEATIRYVMSVYGEVGEIHVMNGKVVKGCVSAFVSYQRPEDAETAIAMLHDKYEIREGYGPLIVKRAESKNRWAPY